MPQNYEISKMVEEQIKSRNITSDSVLNAMNSVPRHLFVSKDMQAYAYEDSPLPIGLGQTISQPYIVAFMTEQLELVPGMKVLEIGTGSGYQAAILAFLGCEVYTIELLETHALSAKRTLATLKFDTVRVKFGDGYFGWEEEAPFDAIIVTAAPNHIPVELIEQMKVGGKMIIPVGEVHETQWLKLVTKTEREIVAKDLIPVRFVPMVNE